MNPDGADPSDSPRWPAAPGEPAPAVYPADGGTSPPLRWARSLVRIFFAHPRVARPGGRRFVAMLLTSDSCVTNAGNERHRQIRGNVRCFSRSLCDAALACGLDVHDALATSQVLDTGL